MAGRLSQFFRTKIAEVLQPDDADWAVSALEPTTFPLTTPGSPGEQQIHFATLKPTVTPGTPSTQSHLGSSAFAKLSSSPEQIGATASRQPEPVRPRRGNVLTRGTQAQRWQSVRSSAAERPIRQAA